MLDVFVDGLRVRPPGKTKARAAKPAKATVKRKR
jgi:hypothetical protein